LFLISGFVHKKKRYGKGKSEEILGRAIKNRKEQGKNDNIIVASKFIPLPWRFTQGSFHSALSETLKRTALPYLDLYQIHGPAFSVRRVETWAEAMADAHQKGLIKAIGVSNYNADQVRRTHKILSGKGIQLATNQVEFSLLRNNPERNGLLATCKELGVTLIAYSPLGMGRLTGKYSKDNPPPSDRRFGKTNIEVLQNLTNVLKEIGDKHGKTCAQVALNWCICKETIPIVGVKNEKQVEENLGAIGWRLSKEEVEILDKVSQSQPSNIWQEV